MPKDNRLSTGSVYRTLPYPTASSSVNMAPYTITASSNISHHAASPPPSAAGERHSSASWSKEMDEQLIKARLQLLNWQPIASQFFPDKTANACRKRHERLMEKRNNADDWDGAKMEALAMAYNEVRESMWRILADKIGGEKWTTVESKCMEKGLKTLQASGRTAARRAHNALHPSGNTSDLEDYLDNINHHSPSRECSKSRPNSDDGFNDSGFIGGEPDHTFAPRNLEEINSHSLRTSPQSAHHAPPAPFPLAYPTPSRGHSPPFPHPARTFSNASSSAMSSTDCAPPIPAKTQFPSQLFQFPSQLPTARDRQNSTGSGQTLPSFSDAFGMSSMSGASVSLTTIS